MRAPFRHPWTLRLTVAAAGCLGASLVQAQTLKLSWHLSAVSADNLAIGQASEKPMGLMQAYDLALRKDLSYAAASAAYRAVQEQVPQARAGLRPQVFLVGSLGASTSRPNIYATNSERAFNQLDTHTQTRTTTTSSSTSAAQQTGFPQFDTATSTSSQTSSSTLLSEQTAERQETQGWQSSTQTDHSKNANAEINLRWPLYQPAIDRQIELSHINVAQAEVRLQAAKQDVAVRLCKAYFDVILSQENLRALDAEMTAVAAQLKVAEQSFQGGETTIADVKEAQAKWDMVQAQKLAQRNALQVRLTALQSVIGQRASGAQRLKVDALLNLPPALGSLSEWLQRASQQSYPVLIETLALAAAEKEVSRQGAAFRPSLDFVANLSASRNLQRTQSETSSSSSSRLDREEPSQSTTESLTSATSVRNGENAAGSNQATTTSTVQSNSAESTLATSSKPASSSRSSSTQYGAYVGFRLNIPLYDGGFTSSKVREAVARQAQKTLELQRTQAEVVLAAETAFLEAQGYFAEAGALKAAEQSGQVALKSNQMAYLAGVRINADILNAQQQLFAVRRDLIKTQVSALLATLRLKASAGVLVDEDVSRLGQWLQ